MKLTSILVLLAAGTFLPAALFQFQLRGLGAMATRDDAQAAARESAEANNLEDAGSETSQSPQLPPLVTLIFGDGFADDGGGGGAAVLAIRNGYVLQTTAADASGHHAFNHVPQCAFVTCAEYACNGARLEVRCQLRPDSGNPLQQTIRGVSAGVAP